jgi:hypothetical protein
MQRISPMPSESAQILQQQLGQLIIHSQDGEVVSFAFAVELLVEDDHGEAVQRTYYGNFQITDSMLAMLTKLQALCVSKSLMVERDSVKRGPTLPDGPVELALDDSILANAVRLSAQVCQSMVTKESDHPDVGPTGTNLQ